MTRCDTLELDAFHLVTAGARYHLRITAHILHVVVVLVLMAYRYDIRSLRRRTVVAAEGAGRIRVGDDAQPGARRYQEAGMSKPLDLHIWPPFFSAPIIAYYAVFLGQIGALASKMSRLQAT
jgi:hypothetical protein